ncbi:molybdenum cofactor guanylyltransferase [Bacillus sp. BRMEA1]|uniref:molybdenum cofactor guanylyltransferase n=1 Tax=Neobacillus endophyticus TaxID=2738405 RepID=UPI001564B94C|nr:molybdenum cofactor guanylyltransferase [Neobacillus endophyticus]NRD77242.1 molybdenum cofactor guanylyltransferase [Neobacillus endophyticus]
MQASAIILAGGKSNRMGTNKALLKINNKPSIERIRDRLRPYFHEMVLVTNDPQEYKFLGLKMTADQHPGMGPLAGLYAGLTASECDMNLLTACDMPFVSGELASVLVSLCGSHDAVVPVIDGNEHPLFAVYHKRILEKTAKRLEEEKLSMKNLLSQLNVRYVTAAELGGFSELGELFFNMNRPNEYEEAKRRAKVEDIRDLF